MAQQQHIDGTDVPAILPPARRAGSFGMGPRQAVRNAYGVQQAVVKITREGRTKGGNPLRNQLQYISRGGAQDLEGQGGEIFDPGKIGRYETLTEEWQADFDTMHKRSTFSTYHLVVSYPFGTDPTAAKIAATDFAHELTSGRYGDHWKFALAHHRDTNFPHAHIVLNRVGANGTTLQLNRDSISIQDLRELHVETAGEFGIVLNASSRFSRNVQDRTPSSGRVHAAKEGRVLPPPVQEATAAAFPVYGARNRAEVDEITLHGAREDLAARYQTLAQKITEILPAAERQGLTHRLIETARLVRAGKELTEETITMAGETAVQTRPGEASAEPYKAADVEAGDRLMKRLEQAREAVRSRQLAQDPVGEHSGHLTRAVRELAEASLSNRYLADQTRDDDAINKARETLLGDRSTDRAGGAGQQATPEQIRASLPREEAEKQLGAMSTSLREIYEKTRANIDATGDEQKKTIAEKSLSNIMREFDEFIQPDDRKKIGRGLDREKIDAVKLDDTDPVRQRFAAAREAEEGRAPAQAPADDRTMRARERLEKADRDARSLFSERGINPDIAMQRVRDAPDVDRETRDKWMQRDIAALAQKSNVSEREAKDTTVAAYRDASRLYAKARDDIRTIKHEPTRAPDTIARQKQEERSQSPAVKSQAKRKDRDRGIDR